MVATRFNSRSAGVPGICFVGIGGAGAASASMIASDLPLAIDAVLVDREDDDLRSLSFGTKVTVRRPAYAGRARNGLAEDDLVDETDLLRVRSNISGYAKTFVLMGLGGQASHDLAPSVIKAAAGTGSKVFVVCTMPFSFEGPMRRRLAEAAMQRIAAAGSPVAVVDADAALSSTASVGNVANELSKAQARAVMTLLTIDNNAHSGALNGSGVTLDLVSNSRDVYIGHGAANDLGEIRKAVRDALRNPLTSGLALSDATTVGVTISAPSDLPVKTLNSVMAAVERELCPESQVATTFVPLPDDSNKLRVSIIAGDDAYMSTDEDEVADPLGNLDLENLDELEPDAAVAEAERMLAARSASDMAPISHASANGHHVDKAKALL